MNTREAEPVIVECRSESCATDAAQAPVPPCTVVVLGATGDLTARKLLPAVFDLFAGGCLPKAFHLVGCGRGRWTSDRFREHARSAVEEQRAVGRAQLERFAALLHYCRLEFDSARSFRQLGKWLDDREAGWGTAGNRIFYLALPPALYAPVSRMLGDGGLADGGRNGGGWTRLVVEKPFGHDLASARGLDAAIHTHFAEHQVFRIDHYLAKETVQNVLMLRFANLLFEPLWDRRYIDRVDITATETLGVERRAAYYEQAGVVRDMFQNHMLQLLALTAMEPPARFEAEQVRDERVKVLRALRPFTMDAAPAHIVLGQYTAGRIDGRPVPGYRETSGVAAGSLTPTYARMRLFLDNWRWQGVPFVLTSGKCLHEKRTEIAIGFKAVPHALFRRVLDDGISANRLILGVYPEERVQLTFETKLPGASMTLRSVTMDFHYSQDSHARVLEAYARVLRDCMLGDQTLFLRQDGVEACWAFLTPLLTACETCAERARRLHFYPAGSRGPKAAETL